jgi:hypothetical protein
MATSGAMRRNRHEPPQVDRLAVGAGRAGLHVGTLGSGMSASKTSSATTTRSAGSSSAVVHDMSVVLQAPGWPANTIEGRACTQGRFASLDELVEWGMLTARVAAFLRDAGELADVIEGAPSVDHL